MRTTSPSSSMQTTPRGRSMTHSPQRSQVAHQRSRRWAQHSKVRAVRPRCPTTWPTTTAPSDTRRFHSRPTQPVRPKACSRLLFQNAAGKYTAPTSAAVSSMIADSDIDAKGFVTFDFKQRTNTTAYQLLPSHTSLARLKLRPRMPLSVTL